MLALQHITGLILFHGDVNKMVSTFSWLIAAIPYHSVYFVGTCCLNHLGLTTHPDTALEKLDKMGRNHDEEVKKWRDQLAQFIFSPSSDRDGT